MTEDQIMTDSNPSGLPTTEQPSKVVPKLKLTFRLPTPPLANSSSQQQPSADKQQQQQQPASSSIKEEPVRLPAKKSRGPANTSNKGASKKVVPSKTTAVSASSMPAAHQQASALISEAQPVKIVIPVLEKKEFPPQFAEQIQILKGLRSFTTRKWSSKQAVLKTLSGAFLTIPMWTREGNFTGEGQPGYLGTSSRRASMDGLEPPTASPTWTCPDESCKKVFDSKEKWRRHQAVHKKKLQLKLPNLNRVQAQKNLPPTSMADEPASELGLAETSKLDSEL